VNGRPALEAVVFDAGGTLIRLDFEWMADDLVAHRLAVTAETLRRAEVSGRRAYDASSRAGDPPGATVRGDVREYFRGTLEAAGVPAAAVAPAIERFLERERTRGLWCRPMEGARAALDAVRAAGLRAAVVSNSDGRAEHHLRNADMLRGIEFVVDSHLVGIEKPDPGIFAVALARLGTAPSRTLFVGDIRSVDERGAAAAGMRFVLLDPAGDYGAPDIAAIPGMQALAEWMAATFELPKPAAGARPAGADAARGTGHP
jgi:HAD superfamily hydrolase (TIGR01509 family)